MSKCESCRHYRSDGGYLCCDQCIHEETRRDLFTSMTNGDHIRAMTDEELAEMIMCPYSTDADICNQTVDCLTCCKEWLQQPYASPDGQKT